MHCLCVSTKTTIIPSTMKTLIFLALLGTGLHTSTAVKHSLTYFLTASSGIPNFPEFVGVAMVDGVVIGYCDGNTAEPRQDWVRKLLHDHPQQLKWQTQMCSEFQPNFYKAEINILKQRFNQSGGVHVLQTMNGCEWDEDTGEIRGFAQIGYNRENFIELDLKTQAWIALKPEAVNTTLRWNADKAEMEDDEQLLTQTLPGWLKMYINYGKSSLLRTVLPSVSLLQKTPSSPVSCHATGFYPDRVDMFWRKDGEELHEDVDHGEILPNNDGTFQMSVDLDISSVKPEDWRRYDCVFQLSGVKEDVVTKLDKAVIRTNWAPPLKFAVTGVVVVLLLLLVVCISGLFIWRRRRKKGFTSANTETFCLKPSSSSDPLQPQEAGSR